PWIWLVLREVDAHSNHVFEKGPLRKLSMHERALALCVVEQRSRPAEHVLENLEANRRLIMRRWHHHAAGWADLEPHHGRRVEICEKNQHIILLLVAAQVLNERRTPRPLLFQPFDLIGPAVSVAEDPL